MTLALAVALPPLFRAHIVTTSLGGGVTLTDVRRDHRAIGTVDEPSLPLGERRWHTLVVFGDDVGNGEGTGNEAWTADPVAIIGPRSFTLDYRKAGRERPIYRAARLKGWTILVGGRAPRPGLPEPGMKPSSSGDMELPEAWWPREAPIAEGGAFHSPQGTATWVRLGSDLEVGTGQSEIWHALNRPQSLDLTPVGQASITLVRQHGRIVPLAARTIGAPSAGLGAVLHVSRAGWLVTTAGQDQGLVWLEPLPAQKNGGRH